MFQKPKKVQVTVPVLRNVYGGQNITQILIALFPSNYSRLQIAKSCLVRKKGMKIKVGVQRDIRPCGGGVL